MTRSARLPRDVVAAIAGGRRLEIRAGAGRHRFIGIWAVVAEGRVFVRSWSLKPRSWYRTFQTDPVGAIRVRGRAVPIQAVRTRSARLKRAVDRAYLRTYASPGEIR